MESAKFLSTLSLRRATTRPAFLFYVAVISIHALLAESDTCWRTARLLRNYFYPRSPCGERHKYVNKVVIGKDFYPRSPCGERRGQGHGQIRQSRISIHALLAESDGANCVPFSAKLQFLSTLSLRRATWTDMWRDAARLISIHALLAESDEPETAYTDSAKNISIHALLAESDQLGAVISTLVAGFLSTLSLRRATWGSKPQQLWHCNFYPRSPCGERR